MNKWLQIRKEGTYLRRSWYGDKRSRQMREAADIALDDKRSFARYI